MHTTGTIIIAQRAVRSRLRADLPFPGGLFVLPSLLRPNVSPVRTPGDPMSTDSVDVTDFHVFDTTLRDGAQREGVSYSVADKLAVARLMDEVGVGFIEGGWPGALPKDTEFFARARTELKLRHAELV